MIRPRLALLALFADDIRNDAVLDHRRVTDPLAPARGSEPTLRLAPQEMQ